MRIIPQPFVKGSLLTLLYIVLFIFYQGNIAGQEMAITLPFVALSYFFLFNLGNPDIQIMMEEKGFLTPQKSLIFPMLLWFILVAYVSLHGESPFEGSGSLLPFLFIFPVLYYQANPRTDIGRIDYLVLVLFVVPLTLVKFHGDTSLPVKGNGFGSLYKISWVLLMAYAYGAIRKIKDIGFYPVFKLSFLGIALISWASFVGFVCLIAWSLGFVNPHPFEEVIQNGFAKSLLEIMRIWIGTAVFEELFFRGLLQNMLAQQIHKSGTWKSYWIYGIAIMLILSALASYALAIEYIWFPILITFGLFVPAYFLEQKQYQAVGTYTALAIISMSFGFAHYHKGSILFVGLAAVAGWAYGYTYLKTKNVFYAALVHALVNFSEFLFQLHDIK
ncbi:MAG: hypothetical protein RI903_977 [Bacteroidota bacterium]